MTDIATEEERIIELEMERLRDFCHHPFRITEDNQMKQLMRSIELYGVLSPLIVRPLPEGVYEVISGHRRKYAAAALGYRKVPVIIRVMKDEDAVITMVDSNLHRDGIRPSEKAFAIKMKYDAMREKLNRTPGKHSDDDIKGIRTVQILGKEMGESPKQVQRYLKITELEPRFLALLDDKKISFNPAFEIAFLAKKDQVVVLDAMDYAQSSPSISQAQRIRALSQENKLTIQAAAQILEEVKKGEINRVTFKNEQLHRFFPKEYTAKKMKEEIIRILEERTESSSVNDSRTPVSQERSKEDQNV